jgi:hypothetical protein
MGRKKSQPSNIHMPAEQAVCFRASVGPMIQHGPSDWAGPTLGGPDIGCGGLENQSGPNPSKR